MRYDIWRNYFKNSYISPMMIWIPVFPFITIFSLLPFLVYFCLFFSWKLTLKHVDNIQDPWYENSATKAWLNTRKQLVLADSLFMRIQPSLRDRVFISLKHNVQSCKLLFTCSLQCTRINIGYVFFQVMPANWSTIPFLTQDDADISAHCGLASLPTILCGKHYSHC